MNAGSVTCLRKALVYLRFTTRLGPTVEWVSDRRRRTNCACVDHPSRFDLRLSVTWLDDTVAARVGDAADIASELELELEFVPKESGPRWVWGGRTAQTRATSAGATDHAEPAAKRHRHFLTSANHHG